MTTPGLTTADAPIGVFDSGVGGLSVLRHIRAQLPHEHLIYFADSGYAPYGDKPERVVAERSLAVARFLIDQGAKALVVACNTATVAAIKLLRSNYPDMPIVGVEPGPGLFTKTFYAKAYGGADSAGEPPDCASAGSRK